MIDSFKWSDKKEGGINFVKFVDILSEMSFLESY